MFEAAGFAVVLLYTVGTQEEDLTPLATMQSLGFTPSATAIVLNERLVEVGDDRAVAFARIARHSVFRAALDHDAIPAWMPKLLPAAQVEIRRLHYRDTAAGHAGQGSAPLGPSAMVRANNVPDVWAQCQRSAIADKEGRWVCTMPMWADPKGQPNE